MLRDTLESTDIRELYQSKVLVNQDEAYVRRYARYDFVSAFGPDTLRRVEFPRLITILEFARLIAERGISADRVLMINGGESGDPELAHLPHKEVEATDYEVDPRRHDLHTLRLEAAPRDFALLSQTLEHLYNPLLGSRNVHDVLRDGAYLRTSVPTVSRQHQLPYHNTTGFTPIGLAACADRRVST